MKHKTLGRLYFDEQFDEWRGELAWGGSTVSIAVVGNGEIDEHGLDAASRGLLRLDAERVRAFVADQLLELYNETWSEDDVPLHASALVARIKPNRLELSVDGCATVYFDDGELFHGHSIEVTLDASGELEEAKIAG